MSASTSTNAPRAPADPPVLEPVLDEHLDEAAFLSTQWEFALGDAEYVLSEVASGPEARLESQLDALVLGGRLFAEAKLLPALGDSEPSVVFAAAYALLSSEHGDFLPQVIDALAHAEEPEVHGALCRALQLAKRDDLFVRLAPVLVKGSPELQVVALEVLGFQRLDPRARLEQLLFASPPVVRNAVLRGARHFPERLGPEAVVQVLAEGRAEEVDEALRTGLILGAREVWAKTEELVRDGGPGWDTAALLWALSGERELQPLVAALSDPARRSMALFALGFCGRAAAVEACLPWLADKEAGRIAAEAIGAIGGLPAEGHFLDEPGWDPDAPEEEDSDELDVAIASLPEPAPEAIADWWTKARRRFDPNARYLAGEPWSMGGLVAALEGASMRRRPALALDLAIRTRGLHQLEPRDWARLQLAAQRELSAARVRNSGATYREVLQYPASQRPPVQPRAAALKRLDEGRMG